jgi:homoserine kinase type II
MMDQRDIAQLLQIMNAGSVTSIGTIQDGMANDTYDVVSSRGRYIVRQLRLYDPIDPVCKLRERGRADVLNSLRLAGASFPHAVPRYLTGPCGEHVLIVAGLPFEIYTYIEGVVTWSPTPAQTAARGRALAMFHEVLSDVAVELGNAPMPDTLEVRQRLTQVQRKKAEQTDRAMALAINAALPLYLSLADHLPDANDAFSVGAKRLLHGDFHKGNVLFKGHQLSGVIDFDHLTYGYRLMDLARSLANESTWTSFLSGYNDVARLQAAEVELLLQAKALVAVNAFTNLALRHPRSASHTATIILHRGEHDAWILRAIEERDV